MKGGGRRGGGGGRRGQHTLKLLARIMALLASISQFSLMAFLIACRGEGGGGREGREREGGGVYIYICR